MIQPLRIAQIRPVATAVPPVGSGSVELVTWLLTEGLVKRGHQVTLFATGDSTTSARLESVYPMATGTTLRCGRGNCTRC